MAYVGGIRKITPAKGREIIDTRQPLGTFYFKERGGIVVGIDNRTGHAWTEEFGLDTGLCIRWLLNPEQEAND